MRLCEFWDSLLGGRVPRCSAMSGNLWGKPWPKFFPHMDMFISYNKPMGKVLLSHSTDNKIEA